MRSATSSTHRLLDIFSHDPQKCKRDFDNTIPNNESVAHPNAFTCDERFQPFFRQDVAVNEVNRDQDRHDPDDKIPSA